ncbi:MAG: metallophosphoesterase [Clostridiales bacterium]|nr:metallophosphoesterase [Clostridiales bacterium]
MKPLDFAVLTDIHYYSKKNWVDGDPYAYPPAHEQLYRRGSEEIIRSVFDDLCKDGMPQIVLISGDLTNNGEVTSHEEIRELLRELKSRGKRVYVTTATHDYRGNGLSYGFDKNNKKVDVPAFVREDLREFYREFGMDEAVDVHYETMCYSVDLTPEYRLLALNDDKGYDHAGFTDECFDWIKRQAEDAKQKNMFIIAMTHHPVLSPSPLYRLIAPGDLLEKGEVRAKAFADLGISFMFTGHSHIHNISSVTSDGGNVFYDISTSALVGFPPNYRTVRFDPESGKVEIKTTTVEDVPSLDTNGTSLSEFTEKQFLGTVGDILDSAENDYAEFQKLADSFSLRPEKSAKLKWIIQPAAKYVNRLTFGKIWRKTKRQNGVSKAEIMPLRDKKIVPFAISMAASLYRGDADIPKDSAEYRIAKAFFKKLDRLTKPFSKKLASAGIDSLSSALLPLLHNESLPDAECVLDMHPVAD